MPWLYIRHAHGETGHFAVLRISELLYSISHLCHNYWVVDIYEGVRNCTVHALASRPLLTTTLPLSS